MELLIFILASAGIVNILMYSKILDFVRPTEGLLGQLFKCSMCLGFYVGASLMLLSPYSELLMFRVTIIDVLLMSCLSSNTCYLIDRFMGDEGVRINVQSNND